MAKFQKGQSGNPGGRTKMPPEVKEARKLNRQTMELALNKFLHWETDKLAEFLRDKSNPVLEMIIAKILLESMVKGDQIRLNFIFDRLIGKVSEKVEHTLPKPTVIKRFGKDETVILGVQLTEEE